MKGKARKLIKKKKREKSIPPSDAIESEVGIAKAGEVGENVSTMFVVSGYEWWFVRLG